jgi:hypothetical protein
VDDDGQFMKGGVPYQLLTPKSPMKVGTRAVTLVAQRV